MSVFYDRTRNGPQGGKREERRIEEKRMEKMMIRGKRGAKTRGGRGRNWKERV